MDPSPPSSSDRTSLLVLIMACIVALALLGLSTYFILKSRATYLSEVKLKSKSQAQLLGENTASLIHAVDVSLLSARALAQSAQSDTKAYALILESVKKESRLLPQLKNLVFLDAGGHSFFSLNDQEMILPKSFTEHRDAWLDFAISDRISGHKSEIILSRRIENRQGQFLGVLAAAIDAGFFYDRYNDYLDIDADAVMLFDSSGKILAAWADTSELLKAAPGDSVYTYFNILHGADNRVNAAGIITTENRRTISAVYQTRGFPFRVAVGHEKETLLQRWKAETQKVAAILALTYLIAAITLALALGQRKKRRKAEAKLYQHQLALEETVKKRTFQLDETNKNLIKKNQELETAIKEIDLLKGIIPICCHCKKIRDDQGYWQQVEHYFKSRSEAKFSHGICPDCIKEHYPELELDKKPALKKQMS